MLRGIRIAVGFLGMMICILTIFKLAGPFFGMGIDLSWWGVFSPVWIPLYMIVGACMVVASSFFLACILVGAGAIVVGLGAIMVIMGCLILYLAVILAAEVVDYLSDLSWS